MNLKLTRDGKHAATWTLAKRGGRFWTLTDHEGCERTLEENWPQTVARVRLIAENYGLEVKIS